MNVKEKGEFEVVKNEITHIKNDVRELKVLLKDHIAWEESKTIDLETRYASKWTEKVIIGIIIALGSGILLAVVNLI